MILYLEGTMPKKNGIVKTYSFGIETIKQIEYMCKEYMLKQTALIEFIINKEYKNITKDK